MTRPESVEIMGQPFAVKWEDRTGVRLHPDSDSHWELGTTKVSDQFLGVRVEQGELQKRDTLLHEILHSLVNMTGQRDRFKPNEAHTDNPEEPVVAALATGLLQVLRANPEVVGWLTEPTAPSSKEGRAA